MSFYPFFCLSFINWSSQFQMKGSHCFVVNAAGNDMSEVAEVHIQVECKTMHGHPAAGLDTHRADFPWVDLLVVIQPNPG